MITTQERLQTMGHLIKLARKEKGYSQAEVGLIVGLTRAAITNIESARQTTTLPVLAQLATVLSVPLEDLVLPFVEFPLTPEQLETQGQLQEAKQLRQDASEEEKALLSRLQEVRKRRCGGAAQLEATQ